MKKLYILVAIAITNFSYAQSVGFESISLAPDTFWDGSDLSGTLNPSGTAYDSTFVFSGLMLKNTWNSQDSYLQNGWAFSNKTDDTTQALALAGAYHSYAGGGANGSSNYAVTYVGTGQIIQFENNKVATFANISVTNNNYAAHSMLNGDGMSKKFGGSTGNDEDWFLLHIIGYNANGTVTDTVKFYLADYRFSDNSQDYIIKDWTTIDLTSLGEVNKIKFEQTSSDNGEWGMNTPAYLAIDNLNFGFSAIQETNPQQLAIYPNPTNASITLKETVEDGNLTIYNLAGQNVLSIDVNNALKTIDVSELTNGIYTVILTTGKNRFATKLIKN